MALLIITLMPSHIVSAAEASNTQAGASIIEANKTYTESISSKDDVDFYKIKAVGYTNYYQFTYVTNSDASGDMVYTILGEDGTQIKQLQVGNGKQQSVNVKFEPGKIYYLQVKSPYNGTGAYNFKYTVSKDVGDDKANAQFINANTKISESIGAPVDQDWYRFSSGKTQKMSLTVVNEDASDAYVDVYDEQGKEISYAYIGAGQKKVLTENTNAGNYYIKICAGSYSNATGKYNYNLSFSDVHACLKKDSWGDWYYYVDGEKDTSKTGLVFDQNLGWWYVEEGEIDFGYNDLFYSPSVGWWKILNGTVDFGYTGWYASPIYGNWYINGGALVF